MSPKDQKRVRSTALIHQPQQTAPMPNAAPTTDLTRRQMLIYTGASATSLILPGRAQAGFFLASLAVARFFAGLVFAVAKAVVLRFVTDRIFASFKSGRSVQAAVGTYNRPPSGEIDFNHAKYKVSLVTLGVADWEASAQRQIALQLMSARPHDTKRFKQINTYMRDEKIRIKLAGQLYSHQVPRDLVPDDLFTVDYLDMGKHKQAHIDNMVKLTGVKVFDKWYG